MMSGTRYLVGLVGSGIGPSASPSLHEVEADALGIRYAYQLIDLDHLALAAEDIGELLEAARRMGFRGLNVTHPCKQHVLPYLDALSPEARVIGAVNTVVFDRGGALGHNTDAFGFRQAFELGLGDAPRGRIIVLGAGGAGAAVAYVALELGAGHVSILDLDEGRAEGLALRLGLAFDPARVSGGGADLLMGELERCDGVIHATPTGMAHHPGSAVESELLRPDLWIADVVYRPLETKLLGDATRVGCRTLDGGLMAVYQAVQAFRLFTGIEPDAERMRRYFDRTFRSAEAEPDVLAPTR